MKKFVMAMLMGTLMVVSGIVNAQTVQAPQKQSTEWHGKDVDSYYKAFTWDIDIQGGIGYSWDAHSKQNDFILGFGRVRAGILWVPKYPWLVAAGPIVEFNNFGTPHQTNLAAAIGGQVELMNFGMGWWLRAGPQIDNVARPSMVGAVGWSFFGIEGRYTGNWGDIDQTHNENYALLATLRLPIGFIGYVMSKQ
jgi:hypothetical protein